MRSGLLAAMSLVLTGCGSMLASGGTIREQRDNSEGVTQVTLEKVGIPTHTGLSTLSVRGSVITAIIDPKQAEIMKVNPNLVRVVFEYGRSGKGHDYFRGCENVVFTADDKAIDSGHVDTAFLGGDTVVALFPRADFGQLADAQRVTLSVCGSSYDLQPEHVTNFRALAAAAKKPVAQAAADQ
jgi:hypothetical protein